MAPEVISRYARQSPVCVVIACLTVVCYIVNFLPAAPPQRLLLSNGHEYFHAADSPTAGLVPWRLRRKWDLLTYAFAQSKLLLVAWNAAMVLVFGPLVEQAMSAVGFVQYIFSVTVLTGVCATVVYDVVYFVRPVVNAHAGTVYGGWVMVEIIAVGFAAESATASTPMASPWLTKVRAQQWPFLVWLLSLAVSLWNASVGGSSCFGRWEIPPFLVCGLGFWMAWAYMRYVCGHTAPSFAFHMFFFPTPVCNGVKSVGAVLHRHVGSIAAEVEVDERIGASASIAVRPVNDAAERVLLPGSTPEEADRRRALALAALSDRIHQQREQTSADGFPPQPSQRSGAAPARETTVQEPDDDHKENAEV